MVAVLIRKKLKIFSWAEGVNAFKVKFSDVDFFLIIDLSKIVLVYLTPTLGRKICVTDSLGP